MNKLITILSPYTLRGLYSQCDSLQTELDIEKVNNKITIDFLSEKLQESDMQTEKLICQVQAARSEVIKQKTLKWIAFIGGAYISGMTFIMYIKK